MKTSSPCRFYGSFYAEFFHQQEKSNKNQQQWNDFSLFLLISEKKNLGVEWGEFFS